jgi:hypothetical protein
MNVFVKLAELFPKWPNFFGVLAGKQFLDLATLPNILLTRGIPSMPPS